ncbi:hypothetical protein GCM10020331_085480 [Ectobacillus funiculus]
MKKRYRFKKTIQEAGLEAAIQELTKLDGSSNLFRLIVEQYHALKESKVTA